ncbi:MAG: LamG domain-containing protein, partial [Lentisphaeria bacterium]|nr:LamG domain-containing protein [Lentisphaeria bacterium]
MYSVKYRIVTAFLLLFSAAAFSADNPVCWNFDKQDIPAGARFIGTGRGKTVGGFRGKGLLLGVDKGGKNILSSSIVLPAPHPAAKGTVTFRVKPGWNGSEKDFRNFVQLKNSKGEFLEIYRLHNSKGVFIVTLMAPGGRRADAGFDMSNWKKGQWYHLAVSWDDKYIAIWQNGKLMRRSPVKGFKFTSDFTELHAGRYIKTYNGGHMILDEINLYDQVLTEKEIQAENTSLPGETAAAKYFKLDPAAGTFSFTVPGSGKTVSSRNLPLFSFMLYDEKARKDNDKPLNGKGHFWGTSLAMTGKQISSKECRLVSTEKNGSGETILTYKHPAATVKVFFKVTGKSLEQYAVITNTGKYPIYEFTSLNLTIPRKKGENVIVPFPPKTGIEFSKFVDWNWAMNYAWDGFIIREKSGLLAFDRFQDIEKMILPGWGNLKGNEKNDDLFFAGKTVMFARPGETRSSIRTSIRHFANVREWADNYVALNYPRGIKKLTEKLSKEQFDKFSKAYLAPTWAPIKAASKIVDRAPGVFIVHPPVYMHPCKGFKSNWDAFPNYFPPAKRIGTMEEFAAFIKQIVSSGNIFMPRTSFYYWAEGSDFALTHDIRKNAIVRIDGKPRTAMWALPGYMMSPSSREVRKYLDGIFDKWRSLGINAYFTNVIGAQLPDHNSFDFHPDAPAPDMFYTQLFKLHKRYGTQLPLFSEDGAFWSMPYQTAICGNAAWLTPVPDRLEKRGTVVRSAPEFSLSLVHEYIRFYTSNTGFMKAPSSIRALAHCLTHGCGLKAAFLNEFDMTPQKRRWIRTTALIASEIHSENYGKRLNSFTEKEGVVTAIYGKTLNIANFSGKALPVKADGYAAVVAPDGFLFLSEDGNRIAGFFSEFAGNKFAEPVLLVIIKKGNKADIYAPLALSETRLTLNGLAMTIPVYPAVIDKKIPGVHADFAAGTFTADPILPDKTRIPRIGKDKVIPLPSPGKRQTVLEWKAGEKLPAPLQALSSCLTPQGLRITSPISFTLNGVSGKFAVDLGFVFNQYPEEARKEPISMFSAGKNFD